MWVKRNEDDEIVSVFVGCKPSDIEGYEEIPDDYELMEEFRGKHDTSAKDTLTQLERITALEAQLAAYEAAYTEGVNEA